MRGSSGARVNTTTEARKFYNSAINSDTRGRVSYVNAGLWLVGQWHKIDQYAAVKGVGSTPRLGVNFMRQKISGKLP